jgi:putative hydrolase
MSDPSDRGNPLQGLLGDLLKMIGGAQGGGGTPWMDAARALAHGVATDGEPEANPEPVVRIQLEELARVAELHVADATGLQVQPAGRPAAVVPVGRGAWALRVLDAWEPRLARMVAAQAQAQAEAPGPGDLGGILGGGADDEDLGGLGELLGRFATTMGPVLLGMQFGSAAGHLAQRALGRYALPIPWPGPDELLVVPRNIQAFADDWSLPLDQAQLWVCVREITAHAVLSRPHVAGRVNALLDAAASDMVAAQQDLTERMGTQAGDPESLQHLLSDPESLLADLLTPGQRRTSATLVAVTTAVAAYVDHMTARAAGSLLGSASALTEAWYRYRTTEAAGERAAGALFGLDVGREQVDRGAAFVRGVVERAGEEGLARLWASERTLPTPAELDAPGLWLERIDLPVDEVGDGGGPDGGAGPEDGGGAGPEDGGGAGPGGHGLQGGGGAPRGA